ncbi:hypothetical protein B4113_3637 [Geobacillus sp. B4113_201601]|nr:hypothetical protein B4113_3637 [Geobacillus sp. B4113_201601]
MMIKCVYYYLLYLFINSYVKHAALVSFLTKKQRRRGRCLDDRFVKN